MKKLVVLSIVFKCISLTGLSGEDFCNAQIISTIAGTGTLGYNGDGIPATSASFSYPAGVAVDAAGNIYLTDMNNSRVRKINSSTGIITTIAGTGVTGFSGDGGPATSAMVSNYVIGVTLDDAGNLYIADGSDNCIRKVNLNTGIINTVAGTGSYSGSYSGDGGFAVNSQLNYPVAVAVSVTGYIYIADCYNHRIRKININTGIITTAAGNGTLGSSGDGGPATAAKLNYPAGVACDGAGNVYISDNGNNKIRRINISTGIISTIAGTGAAGASGDGGLATAAKLQNPQGLLIDGNGNIYVADGLNYRIRKINISTGIITKIAGTTMGFSGDGGPAINAQLNNANGIALDASGNLYLADAANQRIRKIIPSPLPVELLSFTGKNENNINKLSWTTASEINNDYFDVERSTDGKFFEKTGTIDGNGNSSQLLNYEFDDTHPVAGINYYRLKQVDFNGAFDYSASVAIEYKLKDHLHYIISTNGNSNYLLHFIEPQNGIARIYDLHGRPLEELIVSDLDTEININLGNFPDGLYILKITGMNYSQTFKLIKN